MFSPKVETTKKDKISEKAFNFIEALQKDQEKFDNKNKSSAQPMSKSDTQNESKGAEKEEWFIYLRARLVQLRQQRKSTENSKIMDTSWSEQLEKFMLDSKEQGKTPITSSERFTRQIFHFNYFQNKQHDLINRVEKTHSNPSIPKMNQSVVIQSRNDSFFERSPSTSENP